MRIGYGAVERFVQTDGVEIISLDGQLCPNVLTNLQDQDWQHNLAAEGLAYFFRDLDYLLSRFVLPTNSQVLAVVKNPNGSETMKDPRFEFIGYDLTESKVEGGISALTNCGSGFEKAFVASDLSAYGLVSMYREAKRIQRLLRQHYPDEPHASCDLYAIWRMKKNPLSTD